MPVSGAKGAEARVVDVMTTPLVTVGHRTPVEEVWRLMRTRGIRHLPVLDDERQLVGMLTDHDLQHAILSRCVAGGGDETRRMMLDEMMTWGVIAVGRETRVREAGRIMWERRVGALPVTEEARVVGMITATDVLDCLLGSSGGGRGGPA